MSRLKEIFSQRPERMSNVVKWVFAVPIAYISYIVVSLILPQSNATENAFIVSVALRTFVFTMCTLVTIKWFLKFDLKKLLLSSGKLNPRLFFYGFFLMTVALVITNLCLYLIHPESVVRNTPYRGFYKNWICSFLLIGISAFFEELIYRAYIAWFAKSNSENDILSTDSRKILIYATVSGLLFAVSHFSNPEVKSSAVFSMIFYLVFGFSLMLFFFKTKSIEFGLGVHIANNLFSAFILNYEDSVLPTFSLFNSKMPISIITILQAVLCLIFCALLCPDNQEV